MISNIYLFHHYDLYFLCFAYLKICLDSDICITHWFQELSSDDEDKEDTEPHPTSSNDDTSKTVTEEPHTQEPAPPQPQPYLKHLEVLQKFSDLILSTKLEMDREEALPLLPFLNRVELQVAEGRRNFRSLMKQDTSLIQHMKEAIAIPAPAPEVTSILF